MVRECCWYEIGTGDFEQTYWPLFAGAVRLVRPIHHRRHGEAAGEGWLGGWSEIWRHWGVCWIAVLAGRSGEEWAGLG